MTISEGKPAPEFQLPDQTGKVHALKDYKGSWVLLYFYPKDDTPGCTIEACSLRDNWNAYKKAGIVVLGVSTDTIKSHGKFAEKYQLPFPLLADEDKRVVNAYGVFGEKKFMGRTYMGTNRMSFLISPEGKIAKLYPKVKAGEHAQEVLQDWKQLVGS